MYIILLCSIHNYNKILPKGAGISLIKKVAYLSLVIFMYFKNIIKVYYIREVINLTVSFVSYHYRILRSMKNCLLLKNNWNNCRENNSYCCINMSKYYFESSEFI